MRLSGRGFAHDRAYVVAIDGVYFGRRRTNRHGALGSGDLLRPGGLPAGTAQVVDRLEVSDGTHTARTRFTVTRRPGARFLASSGSSSTLRAPVEVWGFALGGTRRGVYLHYAKPSGRSVETAQLGRTGGQCGYLRTAPIRVFPFTPSRGHWTLQIDTRHGYRAGFGGPVERISVRIS